MEDGEKGGIFEPYTSYTINSLKTAPENIGKKVQVLLPIEIQGNINEYLFAFVVDDVELPKVAN